MKIFLSVLSIMMLSFSITFAGTLKVTNNSSNVDNHKLWKETIIPTFEKENPDIKVEMTIYDHEAYKTQIRNFLPAEPPDVVNWFSGNRMKFFVNQGLFEDVSDVWDQNNLHNELAAARSTMTVDGKQWGVPTTYYQWGFYYRKDIFAKYGLGEPRSMADLMNIFETLKKNGVTPIAIGTKYLWTAAGWFDFLNLRINGYDFHMALMDGEVSYEDQRLDRVFDVWGEIAKSGYYIDNHASYSWQEGMAPMINGDAAMYLLGNFIIPDLMRAGLEGKIGYFQFPVIDGSVRTYEEAPTDSMHIPARAKNKKDARRFLAFLGRADIQKIIADASGMLSTNNQSPPPTDEFLKIGFKVLSESAGLAQFYDRDTPPEMAKEGMKGFQEFMVKPDREKQIRQRIERARKRIFKK
ncbi:MAG: extracellular solute-binding protein [Deltaproteobacteria bacterium]|jgi:multiple sugar transport system substrate-binding protein|nr:extracellular solute-binding protein [SAR324 cluster bacterium]MEC8396008.1 extracellular solute-binding protein [SAR324 cluster bacterium]NBR20471.1 extracellular solute-binding protein [Pseudomonadota bacterium]|tara:strand:- start:1636 stop:2862 length:1227 start_codon:yes stop_codon:yes gene_type:complete